MPTLEVDFVSDWFSTAFASNTLSTVAFNSTLAAYGAAYDSKTSLQGIPLQHIGLLEAELPAGATIEGAVFGPSLRSFGRRRHFSGRSDRAGWRLGRERL